MSIVLISAAPPTTLPILRQVPGAAPGNSAGAEGDEFEERPEGMGLVVVALLLPVIET